MLLWVMVCLTHKIQDRLFAGIALVWIFKFDKADSPTVPAALLPPALLFCLALALDLAHAVAGTAIWGAFARIHERRGVADNAELKAPAYLNWPSLVFFWGKLGCVALAYVLILVHIGTLLRAA